MTRSVTFTYQGCACSAEVSPERGGHCVEGIYVEGRLEVGPDTYDDLHAAAVDAYRAATSTSPWNRGVA